MMSEETAVRVNGVHRMGRDTCDGEHPWPWRSGLVTRTEGLRSLPIPIHSDAVIFLLGDLVGRKLRVSSMPVTMEADPGRVTIRTDKDGRIVDIWVDPDRDEQ
jgi:hypothetical protein